MNASDTMRNGCAVLVTAICLGACAPAPIHYHTLLSVPERPSPGTPAPGFLLDVLSVGVPARLDQAQLVVREGPSGVAVLDGERWAGPLGEEVRGALSAELAHRLGARDIAGLAVPARQSVLRIKLELRRLDAWPGRRVVLEADWSLRFAEDVAQVRLLCGGRFEEAAPGGVREMILGEQRLIAALAERIAEDARRWQGSRAAACSGGEQEPEPPV
jgi:uncharacterized lipoprotein YmbA